MCRNSPKEGQESQGNKANPDVSVNNKPEDLKSNNAPEPPKADENVVVSLPVLRNKPATYTTASSEAVITDKHSEKEKISSPIIPIGFTTKPTESTNSPNLPVDAVEDPDANFE